MKKIGYSILLAIIMIFTVFTPVHADNTNLIQNEISIINEIKEFDPLFTYEGELISASKISGYLTEIAVLLCHKDRLEIRICQFI